MKKILVIIPTYNAAKHIVACLKSIKNAIDLASDARYKTDVVVVDDCSTDSTIKELNKYGFVNIIIGTGDLWWSGSINKGLKYAWDNGYDYIVLLNADNILDNDFFKIAYNCLQEKPNSILGGQVFNQDGVSYFKGCNINAWGQFNYITELPERFVVSEIFGGMGVFIPIEVTKKVGLFDEDNFPLYFGDTDYWVRCKKFNVPSFICKDIRVFVDLNNTGIKRSNKGLRFVLKNLLNIRFHANLITVKKFYFKNYSAARAIVGIFLFYTKGLKFSKSQ